MRGHPLTEAERAELWRRWRGGQSMAGISRQLGCERKHVQRVLAVTGGIQPRVRVRRSDQLQVNEREEISRGLAAGSSCRQIAGLLGRAASTVSREVARNGGREAYRAGQAERRALAAAARPKSSKLSRSPGLRGVVEPLLRAKWSPQQISARLKLDYGDQPEMQISHETIYRSLYVQSKAALKAELTAYLRRRRSLRHGPKPAASGRGHLKDMVLISQRPAEVADRAVPGHWEGDLLLGKAGDSIGTLVERSTRYVMLFKVPYRASAEDVSAELAKTIVRLPQSLRRSLTWDRGKEMAGHAQFSVATGVPVYFCDPSSPWQRGTNENTNGLLRQYFPKGQSLRELTQEQLDAVADELNGRPRETLGWLKPAEALAALMDTVTAAGGAPTA